MNQNLVIVRCGRNTLHWQWFEGGERNWDLLLCPFEEIDARGLPSIYIPGQKWDGLYYLLHTNSDWRKYEYICLPDDDVAADAMTWNAFFDYCHCLHAELAAPALTPNSFFFHLNTMQNTSFTARASTFVEIMNPCMSSAFLERAYPTMNLSRSGAGWGLDFLWSLMLNYKDVWIIDETPVRHTKPVGAARDSLVAELACYDQRFISGMGVPFVSRSIGGFTHDGEFISYEDSRFAQLYRNGFGHVEQYHPNRWEDVQRLAAGPPPDADPQALVRFRTALAHLDTSEDIVSRDKPCLVSSVSAWSWAQDPSREATGANDGLINGHCGFHTALEVNPWWQVDLGQMHTIAAVVVFNRLDFKSRCVHLDIFTSAEGQRWMLAFSKRDDALFGGADGCPLSVNFDPPIESRFIRVQAIGHTFLHLDQVEVFGAPC